MSCFGDSPSDTAQAAPADAGTIPAGSPEPARDPTAPVAACPNSCANTLDVFGCHVVPINGTIELYASVDCGAGAYKWTTSSGKITLIGVDSSNVRVRAGSQPSTGRDQEVVTVTWSYADCSTLTETIKLTVVDVIFSESPAQSYGYDDMNTPAARTDHHVSVKKLDTTVVHVEIKGGLNGNEIQFRSLNTSKVTIDPPPARPSFDLTIHGRDQDKEETYLVARADCLENPEITSIHVDVYNEKVVRAVVAKVYDSRHAGTNLRFPNLNVASAQTMINAKAKAAVVRYELSDYSASGGAVDVPYDKDGNGKLSWDVANHGGDEFKAIRDAVSSSDTRIVIVRDMVSVYYLDADAAIGDTTITLRDINNNNYYSAGNPATIGTGAGAEAVTIKSASKDSATVTLSSGLRMRHSAGDPITFPAAGWSSDPIVIIEGTASENTLKWTFFHETGHRVLNLNDLDAPSNIMNFSQGWTDHRIRFKPENNKYNPPGGTQNQWETIPR